MKTGVRIFVRRSRGGSGQEEADRGRLATTGSDLARRGAAPVSRILLLRDRSIASQVGSQYITIAAVAAPGVVKPATLGSPRRQAADQTATNSVDGSGIGVEPTGSRRGRGPEPRGQVDAEVPHSNNGGDHRRARIRQIARDRRELISWLRAHQDP
jgi:hypothetical protein